MSMSLRAALSKSSGLWAMRGFCSASGQTEIERSVTGKLSEALKPVDVLVEDKSGGCGAMFKIDVTSEAFRGMSTVKQHQLVHTILKEEIGSWHGLTLTTKAP